MNPTSDDYQSEQKRQAAEARRLYRDRVAELLAGPLELPTDLESAADTLIDALFFVRPIEGGDPCRCSCHPHLPDSDFHGYGFACGCQQPREERISSLDKFLKGIDEYWASPEGQAERAREAAREADLQAWLGGTPDMDVTSHGGAFPEQWYGTIQGHSFYFRERHGDWRIELDLQPTGHFYKVWVDGDLEDESSWERREAQAGTVIAEGVAGTPGYGDTPVERAQFIYRTITAHLVQQRCTVHQTEDLESLYGKPPNYCPACGIRLYTDKPLRWY